MIGKSFRRRKAVGSGALLRRLIAMRIEPMSKVIQEASPELIAKLPEGLLGILKFVRALENLSFCPGRGPAPESGNTRGARGSKGLIVQPGTCSPTDHRNCGLAIRI